MIRIVKSPSADSRSAEGPIQTDVLQSSTESHISDVTKGLNYMADLIKSRGPLHDHTKIENMEEFSAAINSGHIKDTPWYHKHVTEERHHLKSYVHNDITLVDVMEHVVDCVMAGLARSGDVYDLDLPDEVLQLALKNTVELLKKNTVVEEPEDAVNILDAPVE